MRTIDQRFRSVDTLEGGGFLVHRPFPSPHLPFLDPFMLLDHMGPVDTEPGEAKGAPDHPHRGFETVTYMLHGELEHRDSRGNHGIIRPGGLQWMTAGSGVIHSEMPTEKVLAEGGRVEGVQLWVNLGAKDKMIPPRYQDLGDEDIATVEVTSGTVKVIAGEFGGAIGPAQTNSPISYFHLELEPGGRVVIPAPSSQNVGVFVLDGEDAEWLTTYNHDGEEIEVVANGETLSALVLAGEPLREPVARYGPFVMNTREQIVEAIDDFNAGRFAL